MKLRRNEGGRMYDRGKKVTASKSLECQKQLNRKWWHRLHYIELKLGIWEQHRVKIECNGVEMAREVCMK